MSSIDSEGKSFSFTKESRLLNSANFKPVFDQAHYLSSSNAFLILARENHRPRLGLVVAKKHFKLAVERNRIKRIVRESFRTHSFPKSYDLVVLARSGANVADKAELRKQIESAWVKLKPARPKRKR